MNVDPEFESPAVEDLNNIQFTDVFNLEEIQYFQNLFSDACGVASIITHPDGTPITNPSNFCRLCSDFIRKSDIGLAKCYKSDVAICSYSPSGTIMQHCLSVGLWDAGANISVGDKHIANWLVGQVRNEDIDEPRMLKFADEIGADREAFMEALKEVPFMPVEQFRKVTKVLFTFANELSKKAYNNLQLKFQIAEHKKTTDALLHNEERLNYAQEIVQMGSWDFNLITKEFAWSENYYRMLGLQPNEKDITNDYFESMIHPDDAHIPNDMLQEIYKNKKAVSSDLRLIMPDGKIKWIQDNVVPVFEGDTITALKGVIVDITAKKLKDNELKKLTLAVEQSPVLIAITDLNANIEYVNPAFEALTGYSSDELIGQNPRALKSGKTSDALYKNMWNTITIGKDWHGEWMNKKKNGTFYWEHVSITPIRDEAGKITNYLAVKQDITQRKQTEKEIRDFNANLEFKIEKRTAQLAETNANLWKEIEEHKKVADALLIKTNELEHFFNVSLDLLCIADTSGNFVKVNNAWEDILGYSISELEHKQFLEFVHPEDIQKTHEVMLQLNNLKPILDFTNRYKTKDGSFRYIEWHAIPVGHLVYASARDITEHKRAGDLLEQTRQNYETFFNTIDDFIWVVDENGHIIHTNDTVINRLGYTKEELVNESILILHPLEQRNEIKRHVEEILDGQTEYTSVPIMTKNGEQIPVETRIKEGFWNGQPVTFGVSKDITQIKLSQQKFATAFHSNSAIMAISDFDSGKHIDVNNESIEVLGFSRNEIIGKTYKELGILVDPDLRTSILEQLNQNLPVRKLEILFRTKDGSIKTGLLSADSIYIGNKRCLLTVTLDITERKKAEDEIRKARLEAEHANMAKSEFLSRMSHELRTPMNAILGFAQLLEMGDINAVQRKGVSHILQSGKHLLELINEVLDISRIEAGRISLSTEPVQLYGIISEMMDVIQPLSISRQVSINLISSPNSQLFVKADPRRLRQILLNLLNNAIKYNKVGGSIFIKTETRPKNESGIVSLRISITDTGLGILSEDIPKLFKPFERIGAEKTETEGTGLGLAVVKKLMDAMGGCFGVESVAGVGSTFWIELPNCKSQPESIN